VLRGRDCGTPLDAPALSLSDFTFPLMPEDDSDFPMGVWHRDDYMFFLDIVRGISPDFHFASPSGYRSRPKTIEDDEEFDEWVRKMLGQLRELARVPYQNMVGVTFIS
jgi:hypothetical protein